MQMRMRMEWNGVERRGMGNAGRSREAQIEFSLVFSSRLLSRASPLVSRSRAPLHRASPLPVSLLFSPLPASQRADLLLLLISSSPPSHPNVPIYRVERKPSSCRLRHTITVHCADPFPHTTVQLASLRIASHRIDTTRRDPSFLFRCRSSLRARL